MRWFLLIAAAPLAFLEAGVPTRTDVLAGRPAPPIELAREVLRRQPLVFVQNLGQWDEPVRFAGLHGGAGTWLLGDAIALQLVRRESEELDSPVQCSNVRLTF
jgi:hypothetical protein